MDSGASSKGAEEKSQLMWKAAQIIYSLNCHHVLLSIYQAEC